MSFLRTLSKLTAFLFLLAASGAGQGAEPPDVTSGKRYSLSAPFLRILSKLDDTATITYYASETVPSWFEARKRSILDKLREIEAAGKGHIAVEIINPTVNKELAEKLANEGFQHEVVDVTKDKHTASTIFTGIKVACRKKVGDIPAVGEAEQLEYLIGSKILELTLVRKPIIAVHVSAAPQQPQMTTGQKPQGSGYEWLQYGQWEGAKEKFEVKSVDLSENNSIPADAVLLILARPKDLNERQRYEVIRYLAGGGKVMLIASPFKLSQESGWRAEKTLTGLEDYLNAAGISFGAGVVADHSSLQMPKDNMLTGEVNAGRFPFYVKIVESNVDQESVLTRFMPALLVPIAAEIKLDADVLNKNGLSHRVLAKTSKQSWTVPLSETINPDRELKYDPETQVYTGSKNVFVMVEGEFPFPYEGKPAPEWKAAAPSEGDKDKKPAEPAKVARKPGALVLCSAPEAFHAVYLSQRQLGNQMQANASIIVNIAETFGLGEDLMKLRLKH